MKPRHGRYALLLALLVPGCADLVGAERALAEQASRGVQLAQTALDDRDAVLVNDRARQRLALDRAFDDDVRARAPQLDSAWVIESRKAYAIGLDAIESQARAHRDRAATDRANLDATADALRRLRTIQDAKLNLIRTVKGDVR